MGSLPQLGEQEHQAFDLLESIDADSDVYRELGGSIPDTLATMGSTAAGGRLLAALQAEAIDLEELHAAHRVGAEVLERFVPALAEVILDASADVMSTQARQLDSPSALVAAVIELGKPDPEREAEVRWMDATRCIPLLALLQDDPGASELGAVALVGRLREGLAELTAACEGFRESLRSDPQVAWSFGPAISGTAQVLAVVQGSFVDGMLAYRAAQASKDDLPTRVSAVVTRWLRAAYLRSVSDQATATATATELTRFRLAAVSGAGNEVRARALSADDPEFVGLAREVARKAPDDAAALVAFAGAVEARHIEQAVERRPGRKFTWVHAMLVLALLALTGWHYFLR